MNYYIKGDAANADQIKAAFEKLGYDTITNGWNFNADCGVYFTNEADKLVDYTHIETFVNLIKTHPDYQELELPKHKFGVGDWIVRNNGSSEVPIQIYNIKKDRYLVTNMLGSKGKLMINKQDEWHLWTIEDAIDGDVLSFDNETIVVFKDMYNTTSFHSHCYFDEVIFDISTDDMPDWWRADGFKPATKEQRDLLFRKMKEAGYQWDEKKKELKLLITNGGDFESENCEHKPADKVEPKFKVLDEIKTGNTIDTITEIGYDPRCYYCESGRTISFENQDLWHLVPKSNYGISNFKPKQWVLVRDCDNQVWGLSIFSHRDMGCFICINRNDFRQCIPFKGNEKLLGTTDMPSKEFINW